MPRLSVDGRRWQEYTQATPKKKGSDSMKNTPSTRYERNDPQEREDLIREITKKLKTLDVKQLQQVNWNIQRKWGA
jgi:hypothetical protein